MELKKIIKLIINTYFSPPVFEGKINEPFCLENASNLTHEFLYDNFNKKIFFLKLLYKKSSVIFFIKIVIQKLICQF